MTLTGSRSVVHVHRSKHYRKWNFYTRRGLLGPHHEKWGAVGTSNRADASAFAVRIPRNWHACLDSLVRGFETLLRSLHTRQLPWSVFRNSNDESKKKKLVFRSVPVWEPGTGGQNVETRSSRSHFPQDEMDTVPNSQV